MVATDPVRAEPSYDGASESEAFGASRAGVKGLVDAGVFVDRRAPIAGPLRSRRGQLLASRSWTWKAVHEDPGKRGETIRRVGRACEGWGLFQVVNHGIGDGVLSGILDGVRRFLEQDGAVKEEFYSRDESKKVNL